MRTSHALFLVPFCLLIACGGESPATDATDIAGDTQGQSDTTQADTVQADGDVAPEDVGPDATPVVRPAYFPGQDTEPDQIVTFKGLTGAVRVVTDDRGIPHIYGDKMGDILFAQGYITAKNRLFQMHTLRMAASGRLGELSGVGAVRGDVLLRTLRLRSTAVAMAERTKELYPETYTALERFADGVNAYIKRMEAGEEAQPLEVIVYGLTLDPWIPADTMTIARLQTWDLGFGSVIEEDQLLASLLELKAKHDGTPLEGIEQDAFTFTPPNTAVTWTPPGEKGEAKPVNFTEILADPFFDKFDLVAAQAHLKASKATMDYPHRAFRSVDFGSNNWAVSGAHTVHGKPMVANDTHLALRNPAVFFQVHLSNTLAGGDVQIAGVNFAGSPGITLGTNGYAAWGATVFYSDVTDQYAETVSADGKSVLFKGEEVPIESHEESFEFVLIGDSTCEDGVSGWINNLNPVLEKLSDTRCKVTVTVQSVPHHGPVVPWTHGTDKDGNPTFMTWKWTGFEATDEVHAIYSMNFAKSMDAFKEALNYFGVGAQNWVYGDVDGNIGWYPSHLVPIRSNVASGDLSHPPFLPMPGDGSAEWDGFIPRDELPQVFNPEQGYIVSANSDPVGNSFDNDPFNDGHYLGNIWALGFRMARATELVKAAVEKGGVTKDDMAAVQGDHRSNLGARVVPHLIAAYEAAKADDDDPAGLYLTPELDAAMVYLKEWNLVAESGADADKDSPEARASVATSIFNAFVVFWLKHTLEDEGLGGIGDAFRARLLLRMLETPDVMATYDEVTGESRIWDDQNTPDVVEGKNEIMLKSVVDALAFLSDPSAVGPAEAGGFGTDDMSTWRWGHLHTVTLVSNVSPNYNIPSPGQHANGYPRPGDNFCVDAGHPGMSDTNFTFGGGAAIRNVYEMTEPLNLWMVIPGGQSESPTSPHYKDEMAHWGQNVTPRFVVGDDDVMAAKEFIIDLHPLTP